MPKKTVDEKIDELAISIGRGFIAVDDQFKELRKYFDDRFDRLEFLVAGQERRLTILEDKMQQVARKVGLDLRV